MFYTQFDEETHFEGKLKIAVLNQPEIFNAITKPLLKELKIFFEECSRDENVRCVALTGTGKAFCSGQNLRDAKDMDTTSTVIEEIVLEYYNPLVESIVHCRKPVISLVNGAAVGAGAMLALICDFTLAAESAYFAQSFVQIGLIPDTAGTYYLPKLLGRQMANYLAFTGKKIYAKEAKVMGLIVDVYNDNDFREESLQLLQTITEMPTKAISLTKKAMNESYGNSLEKQLQREAYLQNVAGKTNDFKEGINAFLEKRTPKFKGE